MLGLGSVDFVLDLETGSPAIMLFPRFAPFCFLHRRFKGHSPFQFTVKLSFFELKCHDFDQNKQLYMTFLQFNERFYGCVEKQAWKWQAVVSGQRSVRIFACPLLTSSCRTAAKKRIFSFKVWNCEIAWNGLALLCLAINQVKGCSQLAVGAVKHLAWRRGKTSPRGNQAGRHGINNESVITRRC